MDYLHKDLAKRWHSLSLPQQMANIGAEASRLNGWLQRGDKNHAQNAAERALELIDLTIADKRLKGRRRELTRLREVICDLWTLQGDYDIKPELIESYFLPFAILARS